MLHKRITLLFTLVFLSVISVDSFAQEGELVLSGIYKGTNLYVQNPHDGDNNYCITSIVVNDKALASVPQSTAFDIDLSDMKENDPVVIKIFHRSDCLPKVLNPNAIRTRNDFQFTSIEVNNDVVSWVSKGEKKFGKYFIMKYEHNNWIIEVSIDAKGTAGMNNYEVLARHHSGKNKYKIKYLESTGKSYFSPEIDHEAEKETVEFYPKRVSEFLNFSLPVKYEIIDQYGKAVLAGYGEKVDCTSLEKGLYYVTFDNRTESFLKKK